MLTNIAILVFATVFCTILAVYLIVQNRLTWQSRATKKRLDDLSGNISQESEQISILLREEKHSTIPLVDRLLHLFAVGDYLKKLIVQAGSRTNPGTIILAISSLGILALLISHYLTHSVLLSVLMAPAAAAVPYFYLVYKRSKRIRNFEEQLPEALDMIVNALRSGFTFELAIKLVAQELPDPLGFEFAVVFEEQNLGVPLADALASLRYRVPTDELDILIITLVLHRRTGGNLAEVLQKASSTIRDRFRLKREVRTKTAHGRFSGFVLVMLPLGLILILLAMAPDYLLMMLDDEMGQYLLTTAVIMQILGILAIRKITDIKL